MGNACSGKEVSEMAPNPQAYVEYPAGKGPWFKCEPNALVPPRTAPEGAASLETCPESTLIKLLIKAAAEKGDKPLLKVERPCPPLDSEGKPPPALADADWKTWTYSEALSEIKLAARGFIALGFQPFDSINVWGFNSPEWFMSAIAASFAGGKVAGLYPTDTDDTAAYKMVHSGGTVIVVEDKGKIKKLQKGLDARGDCKRLKAVVTYGFEPEANETINIKGVGKIPVMSWAALLKKGEATSEAEMQKRCDAVQAGNCAGLIYTSGTTGEPKAVMISHDNIIFESHTVLKILQRSVGVCLTASQERFLSYLPLSHVAGMMVDIVCPIVGSAFTPCHVTAYFARAYDLKAGSLKDRLQSARPTLFLGVPLVWEKIADKIRAIGAANTGLKKSIATWAKDLGLSYAKSCELGGDGYKPWGYGAADKIVLSKVKGNLGLSELKFGFTGAAPIRVDTLEYFGSLGLLINEVYGMSECTGACTWSTDEAHQWGSCGWELPGVEVRAFLVDPVDINKKTEVPKAPNLQDIDEKYQGELCFRGRNIMMGYMAQPDMGPDHVDEINKKTSETIDADGWLHSGDKGMVTVKGMVKITGRYKELIIGAGGENIAPVPIEDHVKKCCDGIAEVMMVGDKRKFNVALVTLKAVGANGEVPGTDALDAGATRVNPEVSKISQAMDDKVWIDAITEAITSANNNGKVCPNNAFKIQKFSILPTNFSEEGNELTPTKKLKRAVVQTKYAKIIDAIYASKDTYVRYK